MGGRDAGEVELALHELVRKELVRPARTSSMEGEIEYSFWHLLVRDVAYSQIPRAQRSRRHRAAAEWIERKAGERVEDLAEVLAHHYLQALELAEAAGDTAQAESSRASPALPCPCWRAGAWAGHRAGRGAARPGARAHIARRSRAARAPRSLGGRRLPVRPPARGGQRTRRRTHLPPCPRRTETAARALQLRSRVALRLGEGDLVALAAEAVALLEHEPPGPALLAAYAQLANAHMIAGAYAEAIAAADRAYALAETLGLPEPARALGYHGMARVYLGDADGLAEMERALAPLIEQGAGRDAAILQNNLALARYPLHGPARSLTNFEEAIAFCEQRGLGEMAAVLGGNCPGLLAELGRTEEALERAGRFAAVAEASGATRSLIELSSVELAIRLARGEREAACARADWLVDTARAMAPPRWSFSDWRRRRRARGEGPERASALLTELEQARGARETTYYARQLPAMVRTALATGDAALAGRLADGLEPRYPLDEHALCAVRALLAENAVEDEEAAALYAERPHAGRSSGTCPNVHTPSSARGAANSRSAVLEPRSPCSRPGSCSHRWATNPRSRKPRHC